MATKNRPIKFGNIRPKRLAERANPNRIFPALFSNESTILDKLIALYFDNLRSALEPVWPNPEKRTKIGIYNNQSPKFTLFRKSVM